MILIPIFLMLFAAWVLWGWIVGESKNIKWLRQWCALTFVITAMVISAGLAAFVTHVTTRNKLRTEVAELLQNIQLRVQTGGAGQVLAEIEATDRSDDPDRADFDLLDHLVQMNDRLAIRAAEVAQRPDGMHVH